MPDWSSIKREHVLEAFAECDRVGREAFLDKHGFVPSKQYLVWHATKPYDSKAALGVAAGYATGTVVTREEFTGGQDGAAKVLHDLGFTITYVGDEATPEEDDESVDAADLAPGEAVAAWAAEARAPLIRAAEKYQAVVTYADLAEYVQSHTGIRSKQRVQVWLVDVLRRVAEDCNERNEPLLSALCVNSTGSVSEAYAGILLAVRNETAEDADDAAARERLACYRAFGADLPTDGGTPSLTNRLAASRTRQRKIQAEAKVVRLCPKCQTAVPPSGLCDYCD